MQVGILVRNQCGQQTVLKRYSNHSSQNVFGDGSFFGQTSEKPVHALL